MSLKPGSLIDSEGYPRYSKKKAVKSYPETHQRGTITIENALELGLIQSNLQAIKGDIGIQIAEDGRIWVCINGIAFLRFSPHLNGKMYQGEKVG